MSDEAYVDSSALVAIGLGESGGKALARLLDGFASLISSNLLEAELRSAFRREGMTEEPMSLPQVTWVLPDRPLSQEIHRVLEAGYLRGPDLWHLATALYASPNLGDVTFVSLDAQQRKVASLLGFPVAPAN